VAGDGEREELPSFRPGPSAARGHAGRIIRRYDIPGHALNSGLCRVPGLMRELGFVNLDWRKGTGHASSPSDSGRDIVAELPKVDVGGRKYHETWFVDCKHQTSGVPPAKVQSLLSWAEAERADVALVIASNYLSNRCKDFLKTYESNNRPRFRIRYWERPDLTDMLEGRQDFVNRHLRTHMRTEAEILQAEHKFMMRVWYERKLVLEEKLAEGTETIRPDILEGMRRGMRKLEEEYDGAENPGRGRCL
jgi:Restriction endonuclease